MLAFLQAASRVSGLSVLEAPDPAWFWFCFVFDFFFFFFFYLGLNHKDLLWLRGTCVLTLSQLVKRAPMFPHTRVEEAIDLLENRDMVALCPICAWVRSVHTVLGWKFVRGIGGEGKYLEVRI